jgi:hypothetical protein
MDALASPDDLLARLGREFSDSEGARVSALLDDVSATVRAYTGQQFTLDTTTERVRVRNGSITLPQRPVVSVDAVADTSGNDIEFTYVMGDRMQVSGQVPDAWSYVPYRDGLQAVDVTYAHGYETVPADIVAVVCQIAARALGRAADEAGMTQESIEGYSYSIGAAAAAGPMGMLSDECMVLDRYRRPGTMARLA